MESGNSHKITDIGRDLSDDVVLSRGAKTIVPCSYCGEPVERQRINPNRNIECFACKMKRNKKQATTYYYKTYPQR